MTKFNFDTEISEKKTLDYSAVGKSKQKVEQNLFDLLYIATTVQKKKILTVLPTYHKSSVIDQQ